MVRRIEQKDPHHQHDRDALQTLNAHRKDFLRSVDAWKLKDALTTVGLCRGSSSKTALPTKQFFDKVCNTSMAKATAKTAWCAACWSFQGISKCKEPHVPIDLKRIAERIVSGCSSK